MALLLGCPQPLPPEHACEEVGFAIGARSEACTGDSDLALARIDDFDASYTCDVPDLEGQEELQRDLYECAFVLRNLACELVLEYGDDLDAWMASSPVCALILEPA